MQKIFLVRCVSTVRKIFEERHVQILNVPYLAAILVAKYRLRQELF